MLTEIIYLALFDGSKCSLFEMNLRKTIVRSLYPSISRWATTLPYVVDQSATKSEKGGVARYCVHCLLGEETKVLLMSFDDLSNIRKWRSMSSSCWFNFHHLVLLSTICWFRNEIVHKKLIKIPILATVVVHG